MGRKAILALKNTIRTQNLVVLKKGLFARFDVVDEVKGSGVTKQSESENYHKTIKPSSFTQEAAEGLRSKKKKSLFAGVDTVNESKDSSGLKETKNNPKHYC